MQHTTQGYSKLFQRSSLIIGAILVSLGLALCCLVPSAHAVTAAEKQAEAEEALANLTAMQESLDRLSNDYGEAVMAQEKAEKKRDKAEARIGEINKEMEEVQGRLNERAREMYRTGSVAFLEMVLGAHTFEEFATSLDMANRVNQSDAQMVANQKNLKKEAEEQAVVLEEQAKIAASRRSGRPAKPKRPHVQLPFSLPRRRKPKLRRPSVPPRQPKQPRNPRKLKVPMASLLLRLLKRARKTKAKPRKRTVTARRTRARLIPRTPTRTTRATRTIPRTKKAIKRSRKLPSLHTKVAPTP